MDISDARLYSSSKENKLAVSDNRLWIRAQDCIAQGILTNSKNPKSLVYGVYPKYASHGYDATLVCEDGKKYLDLICGLGTNLFGYGNSEIQARLIENMSGGFSHSLPTRHEVIAAESLKELFPFVDQFKFLKSGSEACSAAIKIARAHTGRMKIFSEGYHGWHDPFVSITEPASGVCRTQDVHKYRDIYEIDKSVAAVIIEPVITDHSRERINWLRELRERCTEVGALLIFDEVITGFRFKKYSVSSCYNILPDLICLGKAIANGLPLAAVGGKAKVMGGDYFVSSTYAGEILSLISCIEVATLLQTNHKYSIDAVWERGQRMLTEFNAIHPSLQMHGYPTRGIFAGNDLMIALFFQEMCRAGFLLCKSWFLNFHNYKQIDRFISVAKEVCMRIEYGDVALDGLMPQTPFAARVRVNT